MTAAAAAEPHVAESDGLRRRHVNAAAAATDSDSSSPNQQQSPTTSTASTATTSTTTTTTRRSKGFVELLFSPLSFVLGDGEPEDPQVKQSTVLGGYGTQLMMLWWCIQRHRHEHSHMDCAEDTASTARSLSTRRSAMPCPLRALRPSSCWCSCTRASMTTPMHSAGIGSCVNSSA